MALYIPLPRYCPARRYKSTARWHYKMPDGASGTVEIIPVGKYMKDEEAARRVLRKVLGRKVRNLPQGTALWPEE
jgi:hypothetical protein